MNGGTCIDGLWAYSCKCADGWKGPLNCTEGDILKTGESENDVE